MLPSLESPLHIWYCRLAKAKGGRVYHMATRLNSTLCCNHYPFGKKSFLTCGRCGFRQTWICLTALILMIWWILDR
jgi:hypothetical protein